MSQTNKHKQSGLALFDLILWGGILMASIFLGSKLGSPYIDSWTIKKGVQEVLNANERAEENEIREKVLKTISINSISLKQEDVSVTKTSEHTKVVVKLHERVKFNEKLTVLYDDEIVVTK